MSPRNVSACEEFFDLVVESHILSAAMTLFNMKSVDAEPQNPTYFPPGSIDLDSLQRRKLLLLASDEIVSKFVDLTYCEGKRKIPDPKVHDGVHAYACEVLILGLLVKEFNDAINEGDGDRIVRCWRYFLLLFKANGRKNYSVEAFNLLAQHDFLLSPRLAKQLAWNRTINTHGYSGKNISADLHMEHLNRLAKDALLSLGSNIQDEAVERIGKCLRQTMKVLKIYDYENGIKEPSASHSKRSYKKDMQKLIQQLMDSSNVFQKIHGRAHSNFSVFEANSMRKLNLEETKLWMEDRLKKLITYTPK